MSESEIVLCTACNDTGWVCEEHHDKPMDHDGCRGAGMPCRVCNGPGDDPDRVPDTTRIGLKPTIDRKHGPRH